MFFLPILALFLYYPVHLLQGKNSLVKADCYCMVCRELYVKGVLLIFYWKISSLMGHKKNLTRCHTFLLFFFMQSP